MLKMSGKLFNEATMNNSEAVDRVMSAIRYEAIDMSRAINDAAISTLTKKIANENGTYTQEEIAAFTAKKTALENDSATLLFEQNEIKAVYEAVISAIADAKNDISMNSVNVVRNALRLCACADNKSFFKYALISDENMEQLYDVMEKIHDLDSANNNGILTSYSSNLSNHSEAKKQIETLVRNLFLIPVENEYTGVFRIRFNKTDLAMIHECYTSGLDIKFNKDKKSGDLKSTEVTLKRAIVKSEKDGKVTYKCDKFNEMIVKLAFNKIFG